MNTIKGMNAVPDKSKRVHEQITEETWCKGPSRFVDGVPMQRCILMWTRARYGESHFKRISEHLGLHRHVGTITVLHWNDEPSRTFGEVLQVLEDLDL